MLEASKQISARGHFLTWDLLSSVLNNNPLCSQFFVHSSLVVSLMRSLPLTVWVNNPFFHLWILKADEEREVSPSVWVNGHNFPTRQRKAKWCWKQRPQQLKLKRLTMYTDVYYLERVTHTTFGCQHLSWMLQSSARDVSLCLGLANQMGKKSYSNRKTNTGNLREGSVMHLKKARGGK